MRKTTLIAGMFGNLLECYDFTVYAFFAPVFAKIFFPNDNPVISLLLAFSVFALSFVARPFGGIFFGYIGDHFGRKSALIVSIITMSVPTLLLGLLPGFASIGLWAPILLTLLRLLQGIAVSGEITTAVSYLVEHASENRRGFAGSLAMCSACAATVLTAGVATVITHYLSAQQLAEWGWRLAFLFGGGLGIIGLWLRLRSEETQPYQKTAASLRQKLSWLQHFRRLDYRLISRAILLTCTMAMSYYFFIVYCNAFLIQSMGQPEQQVMLVSFICNILLMILLPVFGLLSDYMGRKRIFFLGIVGMIIGIHPIFWLLQHPAFGWILTGELLLAVLVAPIVATTLTTLAEMFPVSQRNSSVALGYNIGQALFGGTMPLVGFKLIAITHNLYAPSWYLLGGACLSLLALLSLKESYQESVA